MSIVFFGSYTEMITPNFGGKGQGIITAKLNNDTGELILLNFIKARNPAYLSISADKKFLYAINEVIEEKNPKIQAYKIETDGSLSLVNELPISGSLPCHINCLNETVLVACYGSGNVFQFFTSSGALLSEPLVFQHRGSSINVLRQEGPHAHQIAIHPNGKEIFVPDLGMDQVKAYSFNEDKLQANPRNDIEIPKGSGPRHMVFSHDGQYAYLLNELTGIVSILKRDGNNMVYKKSIKSLPKSFIETPSTSAIRRHPNNKFLYVANRTFDAITIFKILEGDLKFLGYYHLKGKTLREFNISPNGKWLIACMQDSNDTFVLSIESDGSLKEVFHTKDVISGVCVAFL